VVVRPDRDRPERALDLFDLARDLEEQGVALPVLLRFSDILRSRIESLSERFQSAIKEFEYEGGYTSVYPIKVNQQRHVVEEIVEFGKAHGVGLECGSKPELQAVLALSESTDATATRTRSSCASPSWARSSDTRCSSCSSS
jgi:arginine decarboxylase